ncbi:MAG: hypothetical protein JNM69_26830 [Archangium sp.]|nr:hypothetical protein [Archangium sp.]
MRGQTLPAFSAPWLPALEAAPKEFLMRKLGHERSRATRLLEQRLPNIRRTLEEREREEPVTSEQ